MAEERHESLRKELERDIDRLEEQGERVDRGIDDARDDWERKEQDDSVPGAQEERAENPDE